MKKFASRSDLITEIKRIEAAIKKTKSKSLERDYRKYLSRLHGELRRMNLYGGFIYEKASASNGPHESGKKRYESLYRRHNLRRILGAYPGFVGHKQQPKGSKQPVLIYPMPVETVRSLRKAGWL